MTCPFPERTVRVLLVDDHDLVRAGFRSLLERVPGLAVVGEADDGEAAVALAAELKPDLVLMDVLMPGIDGIEATRQIAARFPQTRIIILSGWGGEHAEAALKAGALGYVMKGSRPAVLKAAIAAVMRGEVFSSAAVDERDPGDRDAARRRPPTVLSGRQGDVFQLLAEGKSTKEIAKILQIAEPEVRTHRKNILEKLGVDDVAALVRYAVAVGLLPEQVAPS